MSPRWMTDAEREEIAAIEARCKARFEAAYNNLFVARASGTEAGTGETEGLDPKGDGPVPKADAR